MHDQSCESDVRQHAFRANKFRHLPSKISLHTQMNKVRQSFTTRKTLKVFMLLYQRG